jgi:hypothetical protein
MLQLATINLWQKDGTLSRISNAIPTHKIFITVKKFIFQTNGLSSYVCMCVIILGANHGYPKVTILNIYS